MSFPVTVLNYLMSQSKSGRIIAHCLNFDLVAAADDEKEAERRLDLLVRYHLASFALTKGASGVGDIAPRDYWAKYTAALRQGRVSEGRTLHVTLPELMPAQPDIEVVMAQAA